MKETKERKKYNNGITLVALVITVIVLIILAGVGIGAIVGEDGLITKAQEAETEYEHISQEEVEIVNSLINMITVDGNYNKGITAADINKNPSLYYGKEIIGYTPRNGAQITWKIFYADNENIYLISSNYVENTYVLNSSNGTPIDKEGTHKIYFDTIVSNNAYVGTTDIKQEDVRIKKWISHINKFASEHANMKATAYLLDTEVWSEFKDINNKAEYAIGGPTLELFIASYNDTHTNNTIQYELTDEIGYNIKWSTDTDYSYYINLLNTERELYTIEDITNAYAYWLASPSSYTNNLIFSVYYDNRLTSATITSNTLSFRPIVCLKSGTKLMEEDDGKYVIL